MPRSSRNHIVPVCVWKSGATRFSGKFEPDRSSLKILRDVISFRIHNTQLILSRAASQCCRECVQLDGSAHQPEPIGQVGDGIARGTGSAIRGPKRPCQRGINGAGPNQFIQQESDLTPCGVVAARSDIDRMPG